MSDPFGQAADADRYDIDFAVPQVHRLRFTRDCFGVDFAVLRELLQPSSHGMARVQVWLDQGLVDWDATLPKRITGHLADSSGIELAGDVQMLPGGESVKNDPAYVEQILQAFHRQNL
ncbi:MAG: 3-dehydroquinate synthase, partial [Planctomycetales bacterium]|nr:3-dehydroquinate synthase [Planctomycetales bacterium]